MNERELQLVTFEQAKKLKALGFDWETNQSYSSAGWLSGCTDYDDYNLPAYSEDYPSCSAPTVALALKWFRDKKGFICDVCHGENENENIKYYASIYHPDFLSEEYDTYEAAQSVLLDKLIELLEKEEKK